MSDDIKQEQDAEELDDLSAYERAQSSAPAEDPLVAVKNMRLAQLAVCRLKSTEEMQRMRDGLDDETNDG